MLESDCFIVRKRKVETAWLLLFGFQTVLVESIVIAYFLMRFLIRAHIFLLFESTTLKHATVGDWLSSQSTGLPDDVRLFFGALCMSMLIGYRFYDLEMFLLI